MIFVHFVSLAGNERLPPDGWLAAGLRHGQVRQVVKRPGQLRVSAAVQFSESKFGWIATVISVDRRIAIGTAPLM